MAQYFTRRFHSHSTHRAPADPTPTRMGDCLAFALGKDGFQSDKNESEKTNEQRRTRKRRCLMAQPFTALSRAPAEREAIKVTKERKNETEEKREIKREKRKKKKQ